MFDRRPTAAPVPQYTTRRGPLPRVLVEDTDTTRRLTTERRLRAAGYEVIGCTGPASLSRGRCPVEETRECPGVAAAEVVLSVLRDDRDRLPQVVAGIREQHPELPVAVLATPSVAYRVRHLLDDGCVVHDLDADPAEAVESARTRAQASTTLRTSVISRTA